jgi:hypothetical protein
MNRTTENLLTWAPLGAGVALILSDHKRLGLLVAMVSPVTVWMEHPRATRKALRTVPKAAWKTGYAAGKAVGKVGKGAGKGIRWMAS